MYECSAVQVNESLKRSLGPLLSYITEHCSVVHVLCRIYLETRMRSTCHKELGTSCPSYQDKPGRTLPHFMYLQALCTASICLRLVEKIRQWNVRDKGWNFSCCSSPVLCRIKKSSTGSDSWRSSAAWIRCSHGARAVLLAVEIDLRNDELLRNPTMIGGYFICWESPVLFKRQPACFAAKIQMQTGLQLYCWMVQHSPEIWRV